MKLPKEYKKNNPNIIKQVSADLKAEKPFHYLFQGDVGCGKTYLARIIKNHILHDRIIDVNKADNLIQTARKHYLEYLSLLGSDYSDRSDALDRLRRSIAHAEFIILDDLGDEKPGTDASHDYFAGIVEDRHDYIRKYEYTRTIITTNLDAQQFINTYGSRVFDRITELYTIMRFKPYSFRQEKSAIITG